FFKRAAEQTGGWFTQINPDEPLSYRALELAGALDAPRLLGLSVTAKAGRFLTPATSLAHGEELLAVARFGPEETLPDMVTVQCTLDGQKMTFDLTDPKSIDDAGYLPRFWAQLEIDRLLNEDALKNKPAIIALSKASHVMTPFTSLLVLE